ncbi:MAG: KH domain-containing protein [Eubacteriales bacterium]|nr:KH domain-containing protein [Eubacteriales bacterium]
MKELLELIARSLVDKPEEVDVREAEDPKDNSLVLELRVASEDMGKVIGKQGRIARAIRNIIKAAAIKENIKVSVEILD